MSSNLQNINEEYFIFSNKDTNKFLEDKINVYPNNNNLFCIETENFSLKKFKFFDIITDNNFNLLADIKDKKLFLITKISNFGSSFFGNNCISNPKNIIITAIDPLLFLINIVFYTTYQNNINHYRNKYFSCDYIYDNIKSFNVVDFKSFDINDLFTNYFEKLAQNDDFKNSSYIIDENKTFVNDFLKIYFLENSERIGLIAEKVESKFMIS